MTARIWFAAALLLAPLAASAQSEAITVANPWSRATPPGASTAAAYLTLTSPTGDTLTAISSPAAKSVQIHETIMDGNVMRMRELPAGLPLPAGKPVALQPGGNHIMLTGLAAPLKQGQSIQLHLTFAKSPPLDVTAPIGPIGASHPPMPGMKMP